MSCDIGQPAQLLRKLSIAALFAAAASTLAGAGAAQPGSASAAPEEPADYRTDNYRSPTPLTLKGAKTVSNAEAMALWKSKRALFIDVMPRPRKPDNLPPQTLWHLPDHLNIPNSVWLPNTGYGALSPEAAAYFEKQLQRLTSGDKKAPLLIYCLKDCWMSWNAAKRAVALGYRKVHWFPDGIDGWTKIGGVLQVSTPVEPVP